MQKHGENNYSDNYHVPMQYAYDSNKNIIHIAQRDKTTEADCLYCLICDKELIAKNKKDNPIRRWHFAHKKDTDHDHSIESIIHLNTKMKAYNALLGKLSLNNSFIVREKCPLAGKSTRYNEIPYPLEQEKYIRTADTFSVNMLKNSTDVKLDGKHSGIIPDISVWHNDELTAGIEIISTPHRNTQKEKTYRKLGIPVLYINVSTLEKYLYFESLSLEETILNTNSVISIELNDLCSSECDFPHILITKEMLIENHSRRTSAFKANPSAFKPALAILSEEREEILLPEKPSFRPPIPEIPEGPRVRIDSLPLRKDAIEFYTRSGIEELYPPQGEIINKGLLEGKNILAAIPTACGKTLVAELAMLKHVLNQGKALYIVPLIALANEKYERFKQFESLGVKTGISTGELESKSEGLGKNDIIVCTSEKTDSMLRNGTTWLQDLSIVVIDEVHLLGDVTRGPTLDIVITKLRSIPNLQVVALSATIGNADVLASWLNAELVTSEWRPTVLNEGIAIGKAMNFFTGTASPQEEIKHETKDITANIVLDTIQQEAQCLVFESSRKNSAAFAKKFSKPKNLEFKAINALLRSEIKQKLADIAEEIELSSNTAESKTLADCVRNGAAYHHAGLNAAQRNLVEDGFKNNLIKVISCTPTLAAGLNMPARRVIIRSYTRYHPDFGQVPIPVLEYKQMVGRAGRPHLDPCGYSLLLAKEEGDIEELQERYIFAKAEDIESYLRDETILRSHVLGIISSSSSISKQGIIDFFSRTFSAHTGDLIEFIENIHLCLEFLLENEMIVQENGLFFPTALGTLISRLYINPLSAAIITTGLAQAKEKGMKLTELSLLQLICSSEGFRLIYIKNNEISLYYQLAQEMGNEIISVPDEETASDLQKELYLESIKNTLILKEWINEVDIEKIVERYSIGEGDLHNLTEGAARIAYGMKKIAALKGQDINFNGLDTRLQYGAGPELVELLSLKNVGRKRARLLFNSNIKSLDALKAANFTYVAGLLGTKITQRLFEQLSLSVPADVKEKFIDETKALSSNAQKSLFDF